MYPFRSSLSLVEAPGGDAETAALLRGAMQAREACAKMAEIWGQADLAQMMRQMKLVLEVPHD
ncbi:MAG: hypothetical protein EOM17_11610 [Synergistales bacterium]|nr:hypothetical protein [Synergistales bacterium]